MKAYDVFGYSFSTIKLRKLRSALTTLGVIIGITAIVALLSISQGLQATITDQLNQGLSANSLIVIPGGGSNQDGDFGVGLGGGGGAGSSGFSLYTNYTTEIETLSPDIVSALAIIQRSGYVESDTLTRSVTIYGVDYEAYLQAYSTFSAATGTIPLKPQENNIVLGSRVSDPRHNGSQFFTPEQNVNLIWLNATTLPPVNETYTAYVSGVLEKTGGLGLSGPSDTGVYIPILTAESFFGTDKCEMIIVTLANTNKETIDNVSALITNYFGEQVSVISANAVQSLLTNIFSTIELFLGGIAAISLLVAGISIMNIMIVSLIERTREIGILKALGMKSRTVLMIFLGESVIIGLMGAIIGIILGWGLANATVILLGSGLFGGGGGFDITPVISPYVLFGALGFGVGISIIFALYPAWRASKLKPVDALRHE